MDPDHYGQVLPAAGSLGTPGNPYIEAEAVFTLRLRLTPKRAHLHGRLRAYGTERGAVEDTIPGLGGLREDARGDPRTAAWRRGSP